MTPRGTVRHGGYLWPASDSHCHSVIFDEVGDLDLVLPLIRRRKLAVQAGGNVGVWANYLAQRFETVLTFEPDPANFACLEKNCLPNVRPWRLALGDHTHDAALQQVDGNAGAHWLVDGEGVSVITIDSIGLPDCDFLCLDVEGHEPHALHGAAATIARCRPVVMMEEKGLSERYYGIRRGAAERWLVREHGYRIVKRIRADVVLAPR